MLYINQREYAHVPFNHNVDFGGVPEERRNVGTSGCGLCCSCMVVDHLTTQTLTVEECVRLAEEGGANKFVGTSLRVLGPIIAEKFGLEFSMTNDRSELLAHLAKGGEAIANVGGDTEERTGLFSHGGHYITVISADPDTGTVCILDPSGMDPGKFDEPDRTGKVRMDKPFIYCSLDELMKDAATRDPGFYLFKRK